MKKFVKGQGMKKKQNQGHERRTNTSDLINHMLVERGQLLSLLLKVSNLKAGELNESSRKLLDEFCQVLVDYIASGHFGLYDRITKRQERRRNVADLALEIYPDIESSTQTALNFNEKYDPENCAGNLAELQNDLSLLGEDLASRIELEDRLISRLM